MLMTVAAPLGKAPTPKRRVHLCHYRLSRWKIPSIERPEVNATGCLQIDIPQPRNTTMSGFRHRSLHVKMKHRLGTASADFGHTSPPCVTGPCSRVAANSIAHKIYIGMVVIGRPMTLKVLQKCSPIEGQAMLFEVLEREGKTVVNADERRGILGQNFCQPFCNPTPCPILLRTCGRLDFNRRRVPLCDIHTQAFEARRGSFRTGVVHPDIPLEYQWSNQSITSDNAVSATP